MVKVLVTVELVTRDSGTHVGTACCEIDMPGAPTVGMRFVHSMWGASKEMKVKSVVYDIERGLFGVSLGQDEDYNAHVYAANGWRVQQERANSKKRG